MHLLSERVAGQSIAQAISQLENDIRARPADADLRAALTQLLCLAGNWTRARAQLKSWLALKPIAGPTVTLLDQAIAGEIERQQVFAGQSRPQILNHGRDWVNKMVDALQAETRGENDFAAQLRAQALDECPLNPGRLTLSAGGENTDEEQHTFDWLADGDSRLGPICELAINGVYYWVPFGAIAEINFLPPGSAGDLVWRHSRVSLIDGQEQVCQIPVRYPFGLQAGNDELLARTTVWSQPTEDRFIGHGQKTWLNDQNDYPLLSLVALSFSQNVSAA
ncbi:protein of avirulence locus ImpE [Affinibrenneria salicis]|uniref:Protein of avirulence locus ImpE n=1 Tax=Affinibrenneria salicis TaxID=2590031 RepID=A0A5J5FXH2_9GAMM|nr:type VI secretion system accessory protein TagJ [Affinibrenneria salicis]KAA8998173.1 protein of avirulence locus ImpE [Affinibrenneria salicis]